MAGGIDKAANENPGDKLIKEQHGTRRYIFMVLIGIVSLAALYLLSRYSGGFLDIK